MYFGRETLIYVTMHDLIDKFVDDNMEYMLTTRKIKIRKVSRFDYDKHKNVAIPFFEFLRILGMYDENGKKVIIKQLTDYEKLSKDIQSWEVNKKN